MFSRMRMLGIASAAVLVALLGLTLSLSPAVQAQGGATGTPNRLQMTLTAIKAIPTIAATATPAVHAADAATSWFENSTGYLLFVRSFRDTNGDGIGDLKGVIEGLDYLQGLGVNLIWLMPVWAGPTYHGYAVTDYYAVNPQYGTNDDLIALFKEAHRRGMYIILDFVLNHSSNQHPFFKDAYNNPNSPYSSFYRWRNAAHTQYDTFGGFGELPQLNYTTPAVRAYTTALARYWLDPNADGDFSDGADGYRLDAVKFVPSNYLTELRGAVSALNPQALLLGEVWDEPSLIARFLNGASLHAAFDFPTFYALAGNETSVGRGALNGENTATLSFITYLMETSIAPQTRLVRFVNNHDTNRLMSFVKEDMPRARAAAVWLLTAPGVPFLYYGEEIGMSGVKGIGPFYDEYRREPLEWTAAGDDDATTRWFTPPNRNNAPNDGVSVGEQDTTPDSLLNLYRTLGKLRQKSAALRRGNFFYEERSPYILRRWAADDPALYVIVINFGTAPASITDVRPFGQLADRAFAPRWEVLLQEGATFSGENSLTLAPSGYTILTFTETK